MLKVEQITKYYDQLKAVDSLSFTVKEGEIFGLLGVNGAGKTTTFRLIMGLLEPTSGKILLDGHPLTYNDAADIGFLTEERSLSTKLTVKEQCLFLGTLKGMTKEHILNRLDELLEKFNIMSYKDKKIKELSKGNQQKIQFITSILNHPKLLILDEPFTGLDPFSVELFKNEIIELANKGSMIIFSSHRMEHVELFCKKIAVLVQGHPVLEGDIDEIKQNYQKKNILIKGDIAPADFKNVKGIVSIEKRGLELEIKIENQSYVSTIFDIVKTKPNITKFIVEEPSLNEIFIAKVGASYEK